MDDWIEDRLAGYSVAGAAKAGAAAGAGAVVAALLATHGSAVKDALVARFFDVLRAAPGTAALYERENDKTAMSVRSSMLSTGFRDTSVVPELDEIPEKGYSREAILAACKALADAEVGIWKAGKVSGCVYGGEEEHMRLQNDVYAIFSLTNPLHPEIFPSTRQMEAEVVRMTINMMQGDAEACGAMTSGGTESILLAMKTYRDRAAAEHGVTQPEIVVPTTAHAAFDKAGSYFKIKVRKARVNQETHKVDVDHVASLINKNTVAIVGSAPQYGQGIIDDIPALGQLALKHNIGLHTDGCLGGYYLMWARQFNKEITPFDFSVPGVSSISCDTHKYGYSVKGTSTVLFNSHALRDYMFFVETQWPGGIYASPSISGSRAGGLVACTWASLIAIGKEGFLRRAREIHDTVQEIKEGIASGAAGPELKLMGDPQGSVVSFSTDRYDIYQLLDEMNHTHGWHLNPLQFPRGLHLCVTYPVAGRAKEFLADLKTASALVAKTGKAGEEGSAAVYGMASSFPDRTAVGTIAKTYLRVGLETYAEMERAGASAKSGAGAAAAGGDDGDDGDATAAAATDDDDDAAAAVAAASGKDEQ